MQILNEERNEAPSEVPLNEERNEAPSNVPLIEDLIEQGFREKNFDNFGQAVFLFSRALSLDPRPDLALYLIIDCYWLWNNMGQRDYAITQLQDSIQKYLPQFNSNLRHQFDAWMSKENIYSSE